MEYKEKDVKTEKRKTTASWTLAGSLLLLSLLITWICYIVQKNTGPQTVVTVQVDDTEILAVPITKNAVYMIKDGIAEEVSADTTLASLGDEALPSRHDVNLIEIKDGVVRCAESNCSNQVCVHTAAITGDSLDLPIVCLPHRLVLYTREE